MATIQEILTTGAIDAFSSLIGNIVWIVIIIIVVKYIGKKMNENSNKIIKNIPEWIDKYQKGQRDLLIMRKAKEGM